MTIDKSAMETYHNFEIWNDLVCSKNDISQLFSLKPIGIGSPMVESLSGYISRLAVEHRITTGKLFTEVMVPYLDKHYLNEISKRGGNGFFDTAHMMNGTSKAAVEFSNMLNELTGNSHLHNLTFHRFANTISQRGLLKTKKSWCPACYKEMFLSNSIVYEPLLWLIQSVTICRTHRLKLRSVCTNCFKTALILERRSRPGFCCHCSIRLGDEKITAVDTIDFESDMKATMIEELLCSEGMFLRSGVITALKSIVSREKSTPTQIARKLNVPKTTFWGWITGKNLPSVTEVIGICNKFGINIVNFYKGSNNEGHAPVIFSRRIKKQNKDITTLPLFEISVLTRKIVKDAKTESMHVQALANAVSCNKKTLYKYLPTLCKMQAVKWKKYLQKQKCIRVRSIKREVTRIEFDYSDNY
ncbi:helix-turn-helix domain-containing protein [Brevibacillus invocatus]|uniref:Helix-turn-helix domain-containing protein n=1 Tax=Brevibacillus invocatus TaxID=173959 RepID=A0A3M8BVR7_9BACL|nr:helix-turn-helix domain-containing protein [Brevibacillus invocatus]RNB67530.1 helix-turn-helix domain-containing protein [Brevibacillus invocatus]